VCVFCSPPLSSLVQFVLLILVQRLKGWGAVACLLLLVYFVNTIRCCSVTFSPVRSPFSFFSSVDTIRARRPNKRTGWKVKKKKRLASNKLQLNFVSARTPRARTHKTQQQIHTAHGRLLSLSLSLLHCTLYMPIHSVV
jgi:hypothetical protein